MPASDGTVSLAIDFDGTLVEKDVAPLVWRPKAKEFLLGATGQGYKLWLLSCRCAPACNLPDSNPWDADDFWRAGRVNPEIEKSWQLYAEMRDFLTREGVWTLVTPWTMPGKPYADFIIDDKSELPDFYRLAGELGVRLANAYPVGDPAHVQPGRSATAG